MKRNTTIGYVVIGLIVLLGLIFYLYYYQGITPQGPPKCDDNSGLKIYISNDFEQCKVLNFLCAKDKKPFFDKCGCGCENITDVKNNTCEDYGSEDCPKNCAVCPPCEACSSIKCQAKETCIKLGFEENWYDNVKPNYCKDFERNADSCITLCSPVCGWNDPKKIQCIKYPCAETYSNSCLACKEDKILYWTNGECPK